MTSSAWFTGNGFAFDLETTGPDPRVDRPVSAYLGRFSPGGLIPTESRSWLINPGCPIPKEATAVHGITDAQAARGMPLAEAIAEIVQSLARCSVDLPLVAMNAAFDLTTVHRRARGFGLTFLAPPLVLDPWMIDLKIEPWRAGPRKLADLCRRYQVRQTGAHSSEGDALAAARVVWRQAREFWSLSRHTPAQMMDLQRSIYQARAIHFADDMDETGTVWPVNEAGWFELERAASDPTGPDPKWNRAGFEGDRPDPRDA